jgi:hypothetical protein
MTKRPVISALTRAATIAACTLASTAFAAEEPEVQSLTIFTKIDKHGTDTAPTSCGIHFSTIFADQSLEQRYFFAEGTVGVMFSERPVSLGGYTKLIVAERIENSDGYSSLPHRISDAYLTNSEGISTTDFEGAETPGNTPLSMLKAYSLEDRAGKNSFVQITDTDELFFNFTLAENGRPYTIPVDLQMVKVVDGKEVRSGQTRKEFSLCMLQLLSAVRAKLSE